MMSEALPLFIGTVVEPWGKIYAVGSLSGEIRERYYWLVDAGGNVSMMPADVIEKAPRQP
jgi:hypothetical protein